MNRVAKVVMKMISDFEQIGEICMNEAEIYFALKGGVFSISRLLDENGQVKFTFFVYPEFIGTPKECAKVFQRFSADLPSFAAYDAEDLQDDLKQLYQMLRAKGLGVDKVFDRILGEEPEPF